MTESTFKTLQAIRLNNQFILMCYIQLEAMMENLLEKHLNLLL